MKQILKVKIGKNINYSIDISDDDFNVLLNEINEFTQKQKRLFVISRKVYRLYKKHLNLPKNELFIMPDGENQKNFKNYIKIINKASELGLTRKDVIIAVGGGVVGDIAGFAASTYMRGIDFIQVPTTLLAMVDSSVGGKTAIDLADAKNIVGSFYQPKKVFININFLKTLNNRQRSSGLGEIIKYAFIEESCEYQKPLFLFEFLTLSYNRIQELEPVTIIRLIEYCLNLKISVVSKDEKEAGLRKILNFGHTLGHALETITKYNKFTHGEAVAYGMYFVFDWAYKNSYINYSYYRLSLELLEKYGFRRIKVKKCNECYTLLLDCFNKVSASKIVEIMKKDKKAASNKITFIVPYAKKTVKEIKFSVSEAEKMFENCIPEQI